MLKEELQLGEEDALGLGEGQGSQRDGCNEHLGAEADGAKKGTKVKVKTKVRGRVPAAGQSSGSYNPHSSLLRPTIRLGNTTRTSLYRQHVSYANTFFNYVNSLITSANQKAVANDNDRKSMIQHVLWVSFWIALLAAGIIISIETKFIFTLLDITTYMFYFFICLEYGLLFVALKISHYERPETLPVPAVGGGPDSVGAGNFSDGPEAFPTARTASVAPTVPVGRIALLIPVGYGVPKNDSNAHQAILNSKLATVDATLHAASAIFSPCDIFVIHNSSSSIAVPNDTFRGFCRDRCVYCPLKIGSKSVSAYYAGVMCARLGYKYCIVMDDDTLLQPSMGVFLHDPDNLNCAAYAFAISSTNPDGTTVLTALQDIEYKLSDLNKIVQSSFLNNSGSVLAPHGAINMWKSEILVRIMLKHNCIFHGEDYVMGSILRDMDIELGRTEEESTRCKMVSSVIVPTITPTTFKALYLQRVRSWDLASHQFLFGGCCSSANSGRYIYNFLFMKCTMANSIHRLYVLQDIWCAFQDYIRIPLLVYHIVNSILSRNCDYLVLGMYILMIVGQLLSAFCLEYGKFRNRKDLAIPSNGIKLVCCLIFPVYRMILVFARVHAALRYHLRYGSIKRKAKSIEEIKLPLPKEKKGDCSIGKQSLAAIATPLPTVKQEAPTLDINLDKKPSVKGEMKVSFQEPYPVAPAMVGAECIPNDESKVMKKKKKKKVMIHKAEGDSDDAPGDEQKAEEVPPEVPEIPENDNKEGTGKKKLKKIKIKVKK